MARRPQKAIDIADAIEKSLAGKPAGTWLPAWSELETEYQVSTGTLSNARKILQERGVIELVPNQGARTPVGRDRLRRDEGGHRRVVEGERGFRVAMKEAGREPWDELVSVDEVSAVSEVATELGLPVGTTVLCRARIHGVVEGGERVPVMQSWTWVIPALVEQLPILRENSTGPGGMSSRFEELGYELHWEVRITARAAGDLEAGRLNLPGGAAVLDAWRRCFDQTDRVLEVTRRVIDPANYDVVLRF